MFADQVHGNPWWSWHLHHSMVLCMRLRTEHREISWIKGMIIIPDVHSASEKVDLGTWMIIESMPLGWTSTSNSGRLLAQRVIMWWGNESDSLSPDVVEVLPMVSKDMKITFLIHVNENHCSGLLAALSVKPPVPAVCFQWCSVFGIYSQW